MAPDRIITDKASVKLKGITGDLFLCGMPAQGRLDDVQVITSVRDRSVTFAAETIGLGKGPYRLRAEVTNGGESQRTFQSGALTPDAAGVLRFTAPWADAKLWDTDTPQNWYAATLTLTGESGEALDTLTPVTFGFREIRIEGRDYVLNGTPVHLRALHNTSANGGADKATEAAARELCLRMFEYGFNAIIGGNYDFTPGSVGYLDGLLEACDATGMLMAFSLPHIKDFGNKLDDPKICELYRRQTAWLIRRARNHPSVVFYAMNHNSTGYYGDQNPEKIDGVYEIPEVESSKSAWWERNRKQARIADAIAKALDPSRPFYHHQSGNLGDMHTVNCYLNWAPVQERSDWLEHGLRTAEAAFFVEWGLPHISSWSSYRGPQFIWRCERTRACGRRSTRRSLGATRRKLTRRRP
jgi:beta-galactosidase/beta-glucuronidase